MEERMPQGMCPRCRRGFLDLHCADPQCDWKLCRNGECRLIVNLDRKQVTVQRLRKEQQEAERAAEIDLKRAEGKTKHGR